MEELFKSLIFFVVGWLTGWTSSHAIGRKPACRCGIKPLTKEAKEVMDQKGCHCEHRTLQDLQKEWDRRFDLSSYENPQLRDLEKRTELAVYDNPFLGRHNQEKKEFIRSIW